MYKVEVKKIYKYFGRRKVLKDISFSLSHGQSLAILGKNGSGKTTLLRLLAGLASPTKGKIEFSTNDKKLDKTAVRNALSYVGPEMTLYDPLTAFENIFFFAKMRGISISLAEANRLLEDIGLTGRGEDLYGAYSSGMKQRLKYAVALLNKPKYLLLDEPTSNLDDAGKALVINIIKRQKENGILILATNEKEEYSFADEQYQLNG